MTVPKTKDNIVSVYLDHCSLGHERICSVRNSALLVHEAKCYRMRGIITHTWYGSCHETFFI